MSPLISHISTEFISGRPIDLKIVKQREIFASNTVNVTLSWQAPLDKASNVTLIGFYVNAYPGDVQPKFVVIIFIIKIVKIFHKLCTFIHAGSYLYIFNG